MHSTDTMTKTIRTVIVTQLDPFYIPLFFDSFFRSLEDKTETIKLQGVVIQKPLGNKTRKGLAKRVIGLYGLWGTVLKTLELVRNRVGDKIHRTTRIGRPRSIASIVESNGYDLIPHTDVNGSAFIQFLKKEEIDLVVSVSASQIFKEELLGIPPLGCINLHNGELPKYKGMLPNFWQMFNGETHTTLTIHRMAVKLDEGDIIFTRKTEIGSNTTLEELIKRTKENSASALMDLLIDIAGGATLDGDPPGDNDSAYYTFPKKEDVQEFRRRGYRVL